MIQFVEGKRPIQNLLKIGNNEDLWFNQLDNEAKKKLLSRNVHLRVIRPKQDVDYKDYIKVVGHLFNIPQEIQLSYNK